MAIFFLVTYSFASLYRRCPCVGIHFISFLTDEERSASLSKDVQMIQPRLTALYSYYFNLIKSNLKNEQVKNYKYKNSLMKKKKW